MTLTVRPMLTADRDALRRIVVDAFGEDGDRVARLVDELERTGHVRASLVAEQDGQVVGHVQLNRSWLDARQRLVEVLVLSPLAVAPDRQRRGGGAALVAAALKEAQRLASPAVFLEGDPAFYSRCGFEPAEPHGFKRPSDRIPGAAFQVVLLPSHEPWMTGALVYCDPFWVLDCVGLRDPALAEIEQKFEIGV